MAVDSLAPVVTLDGPSGSGKGTVGMLIADRLGWHYLDSGALYRIVALKAEESPNDDLAIEKLIELIQGLEIRFEGRPEDTARVLVNGAEVTEQLRSDRIAQSASGFARLPEVRLALLERQRSARRPPGLIADGRDMGTVVFPDACLKLFLTASAEIRGKRRYNQLKQKEFDVNLPRLIRSIQARDEQDQSRQMSPLRPALDAEVIDTSGMSIADVVSLVMERIRSRADE